MEIHIYRTAGRWYAARWAEGEYDGCDVIDVDDTATEEEAAAAVIAEYEGDHTITRVADPA